MTPRSIAGIISLSIAVTPIPALADNAFVGGLVGGMIGSAIANQPKRQVVTKRYVAPRKSAPKPAVSSATREANRMTQTALNYFGFDAGTPDGILGSRSRSAISTYQGHMGYTPTGQLTQYERDFLVSSYRRAQAGGPATAQQVASNPQGVRGLLIAYRDGQVNRPGDAGAGAIAGHYGLPAVVAEAVNEIAKSSDPSAEQLVQRSGFIQLSDINGDGRTDYILDTSVTGSAFWCNAQSCAVRVFASTPEGYERNDFQAFNVTPAMFSCTRGTCSKDSGPQMAAAPVPAAPAPAPELPQTQMASAATPVPSAQPVVQSAAAPAPAPAAEPAIPDFFGGGGATEASLQSRCNTVSLMTSTNGGYITPATLSDPSAALAEQLCLARTYAIAKGEDLIAKVPGATPEKVAQQCAGFGKLLREQVSAVSLRPRDAVVSEVGSFVLASGMAPAQLEKTAMICLSAGYRVDDLDAAMGSALVLVSLGKAPYAELIGHHLSQGIGASHRDDLAAGWYGQALEALEGGSTPVFSPGMPERTALLRKASMLLGGGTEAASAAPAVVPAAQEIPVFSVGE
ncbi:peptidoglycan-binding domain-containing protein [Alloyangia pacifica]|uniref:peptidoglycan-binding domain-containing protein n=1 Tax=Alloyangia pacifica TaxID=311180 RepID=UPI001CD5133B|nr:peptidoglycan-binding domain-containing protein [Alloyangia pacifica]MCA0997668.1 peptidoglycan-binding protein [Alloyangia pacifica]